jgi:hypothetical protein
MAAQSALGLIAPWQYRDVEWIRATWFGNDWCTLAVATPMLLVAARRASGGSTRGLLVSLGVLGYAVYNYAFYLFGAALNAFFPVYVILVVVAAVTLILALSRVNTGEVAASVGPATPVRVIGGCLAFIGLGLAAVWIAMWAAYIFAGRPTPIEPEAFKLVAALDLSLMTTTLVAGGALLWQRHVWGFIVAAIAGIQASLYLLVLSVNSVVAIHRGLAEAPGELPAWGALAAFSTGVTMFLFVNVRARKTLPGPPSLDRET